MVEKEKIIIPFEPVAFKQLAGEPYCRTVNGNGRLEVINCNVTANRLSHESGYYTSLVEKVKNVESLLEPLFTGGYHGIDKKIKHGENLDFSEAFSLITFVCSALNRPLHSIIEPRLALLQDDPKKAVPLETRLMQATSFLASMSAKEAYVGLTALEIAGFVAATIYIDTFTRLDHNFEYTIGFGGMGGDKGYPIGLGEDTKLFSLSTLGAIGLSVDVPVHKHHSYPNTSKVAGQSAIEEMGARSDFHTRRAMGDVFDRTGLIMSSCHDTRTLHTLSHVLKGETINHVIGPLAFPVDAQTPFGAMIGVNEKIHPNIIIEALRILNQTGSQKYVNGVAFCGTNLREIDPLVANSGLVDSPLFRQHVRIDELAPPPYVSIASFLRDGENIGAFIITPEDFYDQRFSKDFDIKNLLIPNTKEAILDANRSAISGMSEVKARYLAMTIGLGLFLKSKLELSDSLDLITRRVNRRYLRECTQRALDIIQSGAAQRQQEAYVNATLEFAGKKI